MGGTSLLSQWLRFCAPSTGGPGFDSWLETKSHMLQLPECHKSEPACCNKDHRFHVLGLRPSMAKY